MEDTCTEMEFGKLPSGGRIDLTTWQKISKYHLSAKLHVLRSENAGFIFENRMYDTCVKEVFLDLF